MSELNSNVKLTSNLVTFKKKIWNPTDKILFIFLLTVCFTFDFVIWTTRWM